MLLLPASNYDKIGIKMEIWRKKMTVKADIDFQKDLFDAAMLFFVGVTSNSRYPLSKLYNSSRFTAI